MSRDQWLTSCENARTWKVLFKNYHTQMQVPFVIYADFKAITEKIHGCNRNNQQSYTDKYQKHTGCGYGYRVL